MLESDLVIRAAKLHGLKTRGMAIDLMHMARRLKRLDKLISLLGLDKTKKRSRK